MLILVMWLEWPYVNTGDVVGVAFQLVCIYLHALVLLGFHIFCLFISE